MAGPVTQLRISGLFCPCVVDDGKQAASCSANSLQTLPITWYRTVQKKEEKKYKDNNPPSPGGVVDSLLYNVFGGPTPPPPYSRGGGGAEEKIGIKAKLSVIDSSQGPALEIISDNNIDKNQRGDPDILIKYDLIKEEEQDEDIPLTATTITEIYDGYTNQKIVKRIIPLRNIDSISRNQFGFGDIVSVYGLPGRNKMIGTGRNLLRFGLLQEEGKKKEPYISFVKEEKEKEAIDKGDQVIQQIETLIKWERIRHAQID